MARVLILGLDGFGPGFARRAFEAGLMPFLAARAKEGSWGPARSTLPPVSTAAWTTISTGVGVGRHGILDFHRRDLADYAFLRPGRLVNSRDVKAPRLWDLAGRAGLSSFILNLPVTFPAAALEGAMVTGVLTPAGSDRGYYPPAFAAHLKDYNYDLEEPIPADLGGLCGALAALERRRAEVAAAAFGRDRYDLGLVVFTGPDRLFHKFYREVCAVAEIPAAAAAYLRELDAACERASAAFGADAPLIVCSDHGFGPGPTRAFYVNRLLRREGLLAAGVGPYVLNVVAGAFRRFAGGGALPVDWRRTQAYGFPLYMRWGGVVLNVKGEQAEGCLAPKEAAGAAARVIALLEREEAVAWARPREEVFAGPYVGNIPHVVFALKEGFVISEGKGPGPLAVPYGDAAKEGDHSPEAMALLAGVAGARVPADAAIGDVAATAAALLGLGAAGMEGRSWV